VIRQHLGQCRKDGLEQMGVDEIYFGKQMKFITVVSNLETGEPLWFGQDRKQETPSLLKGALLGSCGTFSTLTPHSGQHTRYSSMITVVRYFLHGKSRTSRW
jgi:hypothetical protein